MVNKLESKFLKLYNVKPDAIFRAPGRVNLIGEHIDYNGGKVLPAAISLYTYVCVRKREDSVIRLASDSFNDEILETNLNNISFNKEVDWVNYPIGLIDTLRKLNKEITSGLDLYFYSEIPLGSGLSSSASILIVTLYMLNSMFSLGLSNEDLVRISTKSEREFNGLTCGIMDEASIALAKEGYALYLDTNDFTYSYEPIDLGDYCLAILKTNKTRKLTESKYNERVKECNDALLLVKRYSNVDKIINFKKEDLNFLIKHDIVLSRRATHVVQENERVEQFVRSFKEGNILKCGSLLNESHASLKSLYEVTGEHLDVITELARNQKGCLGSRMTGAGFGGCAIALVHKSAKKDFEKNIVEGYLKKFGFVPEIIFTNLAGGPTKLSK